MGLLTSTLRRQLIIPNSPNGCPSILLHRKRFHSNQLTTESSSTSPDLALLIAKYSQQPPRPLSLHKLLSFGSPLTRDSLLESASFALSEIPRRLVSRVRALEALPFIVTTNPFLSRTLRAYRTTFETLATHPPIKNLSENWVFTRRLEKLVSDHGNDIPTMAKGFQECARYMSSADISKFLDHAIRNRIGVRLIAEQHIALSRALRDSPAEILYDGGVVDTECSPAQLVRMCGKFVADLCEATLGLSPPLVIDGDINTTFAYVPVHLEFALTELLKNAFRATVEHHYKLHGPYNSNNNNNSQPALPPVIVTIAPPPPSSVTSIVYNKARTPHLSMRIRDQGGGVSPAHLPFIFSYAFTTTGGKNSVDGDGIEGVLPGGPYAGQYTSGGGDAVLDEGNLFSEITSKGLQTGMGTLSGLGYGLPLAKLYATYFGGDLQLFSLYNHGTDVFLRLRCLQKADSTVIS